MGLTGKTSFFLDSNSAGMDVGEVANPVEYAVDIERFYQELHF